MEILIPGLILVGLMYWASTKIKQKAADAYRDEVVETDNFRVEKPDGFISPAYPEEGLVFAAYSKEFGRDRTRELRQAELEVRRRPEVPADHTSAEDANDVLEIPSSNSDLAEFVRFVSVEDGAYEMRGRVLVEHRQEFARKLKEMMASFSAK